MSRRRRRLRRLARAWSVFAGRFLGIRTGPGRRPVGTFRPADSTIAALAWAWASVTAVTAILVLISTPGYPVPEWVFGVAGAVALLWAPTLRAVALTLREWPQLIVLALGVGAPVWVVPTPARAAITPLDRFAFWASVTAIAAIAVPLLAFSIRVLRARPERPPEPTPL
jgi:hypothetical protein